MKIATFNINNVNKRLTTLLAWMSQSEPDVVCLQELKATDSQFPHAAIEAAGYSAIWRGQSAWNGVAILAKGNAPVLTRSELPGDDTDRQSRYLEAAVNGIIVGCLYAPNGNPQPGPKFDYKLAWHRRFAAHAAELMSTGLPVVLAGDYNIVPGPQDIYATRSYASNALLQPQSREAFHELLSQGWVDALRKTHPGEAIYTFWDYRRKRWERDAGLRIDHMLLSKKLGRRLKSGGVDRWVRGENDASDHAPVWIELK